MDELSYLQTCGAFGAVGARVDDLCVYARNRLRWLEVLLVGQADGMGEKNPVLLRLICIAVIIGGDAYFDVSELTALGLDSFSDVFAGSSARGLLVAGQAGGHDQRTVQVVMFLPDLTHFYVCVADGIGPVTRCPLCDVLGL